MAETKFREDYVRTGKVGYVPYGNDKLIPDFEIERLLRDELQFEGRDKSRSREPPTLRSPRSDWAAPVTCSTRPRRRPWPL